MPGDSGFTPSAALDLGDQFARSALEDQFGIIHGPPRNAACLARKIAGLARISDRVRKIFLTRFFVSASKSHPFSRFLGVVRFELGGGDRELTQRAMVALVEWATEIKVRAERKAGEILATIERSNGGRGKTEASVAQVYRDNDIPPTTGKRWQKLAAVPEEKFEQAVAAEKLAAEGLSQRAIGEVLGVDETSVRRDLAAANAAPDDSPRNDAPDASAANAAPLDAVAAPMPRLVTPTGALVFWPCLPGMP